jgi:predicted CXXCH cytochrome family protein
MRYLSLTIVVLIMAINVQGQTSPHGKEFQIDCAQCHTSANWKVNPTAIQFNHDNTNFKLDGQHKVTNCRDCHLTLTFIDGRRNCLDCHTDAHNQSLGKDCGKCHTPKTWIISDVTAMHQKTRFPLLGAHRSVSCNDCHKSASKFQFEPLGIECVNCHNTDFQKTTSPNHVANKYSTFCLDCHNENTNSWKTTLISHDFFPLTGGHNVGCGLCHTTSRFTKISKECNTCHNKQYLASQIPAHATAGISIECATCHTTSAWKPASFNHTTTGYELKGAHKLLVQCSLCHKGNVTSAPQTCIGCHQAKYDVSLNHKAQRYPTDCTMCHTQNNWLENSFNHATTAFPLTGAHTSVLCSKCHTVGFKGTPIVCSSCHLPAYTSSKLPDHVAAGIPKECATCHTMVSWKPASFNHTTTGYELKGAHKLIVQCSQCHKGNVTSAPQVCIGCHQAQYDTAPSHKSSGFSTDCAKCHSQNNWLSSSFDHSTTNFPLTGAHTKVLCSTCHVKGYAGTSTACSNCHLPVYTSSQLPGHVAAGIPKECATCHTTAVWKPSTFNHTTTGYELKGAHKLIVQCSQCHKGNVTTASLTCVGCHQAKYDAAPNHKAQGFPTDCAMCHTQNNWLENSFNHATTAFPLTGAHTTVLCSKCHTTSFKGTSTLCFTCHATKYNASTNPNHLAAKFPTNCEICHSTKAWTPSTYNHDAQYFPINSGKHNGKWTLCSECHSVATNYASFTCILCHEHSNKTSVDGDHKGVKNYAYTPTSCYTCHPRGNT